MNDRVDPLAARPDVSVTNWNVANLLTAVRLLLVPLFGWLLLHADGSPAWRGAAAGVFVVAGLDHAQMRHPGIGDAVALVSAVYSVLEWRDGRGG